MKKSKNRSITLRRSALCLLLCAACTCGFSPSRSTAEILPEVGPTFLSEQEQVHSSHIRRLDDFNDQTDAVGYLNADGSKTVYIYADDVRYQDASGRMIDKNIHLTEITAREKGDSNYRYRTAANDITAYYPNRLSDSAIVWEYQGHRISLQPQCGSTSAAVLEDGTKAVYQTTSGEISCDSLLSGTLLRHTISSMDVTSVAFDANFGDLTPLIHENTILLTDSEGVEQICFGGLLLTDSDGAASDNLSIALQEQSDGIYTVSVELDSEFLTASAAESVVTLNTSITIPSGTNLTGASVYSKEASTTHGQSIVHHIGYNATKGTAYTFVKFNLSALDNIRYDNITSACYRFTEGSSNDATAVLQAYFVKSAWNESTITWNNKPAYYNEIISSANINNSRNSSQYDLYITKAVQGWLQGLPNYGIMFRERDDDQWQTLFSDNCSINQPCLVVTYVDDAAPTQAPGIKNDTLYYLLNKANGKYLAAAGTTTGSYVTENSSAAIAQKAWTLSSRGNNYYSITCNGLALTASSTASGSTIKLQTYSSTNTQQQWKIIRNWDGSYQLINKAAESRSLCLSGGAQTNGTNVKLAAHTLPIDTTKRNADWTLIPAVKGTASFLFFNNMFQSEAELPYKIPTQNTMSNLRWFSSNMGYSTQLKTDFVNVNSSALELMKESAIYFCLSHGLESSQSYVGFDLNHASISRVSENYFCNSHLIIYQGCRVGANTTNDTANMTGLTYKRGAHYVISHPKNISYGFNNTWSQVLFASFSVESPMGVSKKNADDDLFEKSDPTQIHGNMNYRHDLGDDSFRFDLPDASQNTQSSLVSNSIEKIYTGNFSKNELSLESAKNELQKIEDQGAKDAENVYTTYKDAYNNVYFVRANTLETYLPNIDGLELGHTDVDSETALQQASTFLSSAGYDITGFTITHSNEYSKKYRVIYQYNIGETETTEKLYLYFEAEQDGTVHLVRFAAYDYGSFSAADSPVPCLDDFNSLFSSLEQAARIKAAGASYKISKPVWIRNKSGNFQLRAYIDLESEDGIHTFKTAYSNLLQQ